MITFDPTNSESFKNCAKWLEEANTHLDRKVSGVLVATKSDLREFQTVSREEAEGFAAKSGLEYFETSAVC